MTVGSWLGDRSRLLMCRFNFGTTVYYFHFYFLFLLSNNYPFHIQGGGGFSGGTASSTGCPYLGV